MRISLIFLVIIFSIPRIAYSAELDGVHHDGTLFAGLGTMTCKEFSQLDSVKQELVFAWAQGYMSAINVRTATRLKVFIDLDNNRFNIAAQKEYLKTRCDRYPDSKYMAVLTRLMRRMMEIGLTYPAPENIE